MKSSYDFIPAEEKHLNQLVPLLASTGYWDFGLQHNDLKLDSREFMREYVAKPNLRFTTIAVKKGNPDTVIGVMVCASKKEIAKMPNSAPSLDPQIVELFKNLLDFEITDSFHISFLAISKEARGQGLGTALMCLAEDKAKKAGYETLSLYTFCCQTSSIKLYLKLGMMITKPKFDTPKK